MHDQRDDRHLARSQSPRFPLPLSKCALNRTRIGRGPLTADKPPAVFVPSMTLCRSNPHHRGWDEANRFEQTSPSDGGYPILSSDISLVEVVKYTNAGI